MTFRLSFRTRPVLNLIQECGIQKYNSCQSVILAESRIHTQARPFDPGQARMTGGSFYGFPRLGGVGMTMVLRVVNIQQWLLHPKDLEAGEVV